MKSFNEVVNGIALAKIQRSESLGTAASWGTNDQSAAFVAYMAEHGIEVTMEMFKDIYNVSGTAQRLEKVAEALLKDKVVKGAHFVRQSIKAKRGPDGYAAFVAGLEKDESEKE